MKILFGTLMLATAFIASAPARAQVAASDSEATAKLDPKDPNYIKCRRLSVTGSLVKKERICKTNAEWNAISDQQRRDGDDLIERSRAGMNPNGA